MKIVVAFVVIFVIGICDGQTNPIAGIYGRGQRVGPINQETSNEVLINTDRLMSSLESRVLSIVRSETATLKQQLGRLEQSNSRLENAISLLKDDVGVLKTALDKAQGMQDQELSKQQPINGDDKLDDLSILINAVRSMISKIERDVVIVKKNVKSMNGRPNPPQIALVSPQGDLQFEQQGACSANDPNTESGVRKISRNFFAFCEMDDEDAGGWIVIQNRFDGTTEFFRRWNEYKEGFGNIAGEFWLGLEKIYELTSSRLHELTIVMKDFNGVEKTAKYSAFGISDESSGYTLNMLGKYSGDAEDSFMYHAGYRFSTFDNDNDGWSEGNCAKSHLGGWWYNSCDESNLNGKYFEGGIVEAANSYQGIYWSTFNGLNRSLKSVKMMIRPVEA